MAQPIEILCGGEISLYDYMLKYKMNSVTHFFQNRNMKKNIKINICFFITRQPKKWKLNVIFAVQRPILPFEIYLYFHWVLWRKNTFSNFIVDDGKKK